MEEAVLAAGNDILSKSVTPVTRIQIDRNKPDGVLGKFMLDPFSDNNIKQVIPISAQVDINEVSAALRKSMKERKLDTIFEFGVESPTPHGINIQLSSRNFVERLRRRDVDSALYQEIIVPLADNLTSPTMEVLHVFVPQSSFTVFKSLGWMIFGSIVFTIIIVTAFALTIRTMLGQKKLSEIKSDFINNMTHELKTPLATISLAIDAIGNERVMENKEKIRYFSGIIKEENKRMNKQVESILQSALMEKEELTLNLQPIDVHQLITHTIDNLRLQLDGKNGRVELQLNAIQPILKADEVHFSNLIFNLLDNAIKYSKDNLEIRIATSNTRKNLVISIADNGIGMSRDTVSRIFEKFYRAHTGNVHNVKGFGLGLTYVKAIVDAHKGKIRVESVIGKGSRFTMEFPQE
ncbi:sensor histidine kinase [Chitinophaga sp. NPDC101104]|uniref:sensor histidine kinase n=1 Tax=Chitinophaga sp. NPDC101104 TaxID=3390561 RepID=UPI003CFCF377